MRTPKTKTTFPNELINKTELAKRLACTTRHCDALTAKGLIKRIRLGAVSRYDWPEVVANLKAASN